MIDTALHTSPSSLPMMATRPGPKLHASQLSLVLDCLMQLKWMTEEHAVTESSQDVLDAIWRTQVRLLGGRGRLSRAERFRLLSLLREHANEGGERLAILVDRIESALT